MSQKVQKSKLPGITLEEETQTLAEILDIAEQNLNRTRVSVQSLADELNTLKEVYDADDKEGLAQWFNTDARFQQVRQELLRSERSRKKPYFGRIDFQDDTQSKQECYYIGKSVIAQDAAEPRVIDWRAPIASVYYEKALGKCTYSVKDEGKFNIDLFRKRTYEIENDKLKDFFDSDVVANDELLTKYLAKNKRAVLSEIIATIQQEQNEIIRMKPQHNIIVQGGAGSGKTTVAMHRISYILYNYDLEFKPKDFYIIGSNKILLNYITGILPDLDVYGASQMTMDQLFVRLLYEDWDPHKFTVKSLDKKDKTTVIKGSFSWFHDLEAFCERYEWTQIPHEDIYVEKTKRLLMSKDSIQKLFQRFHTLSLQDKVKKLTEHLMAQLENEIYGRYYSYPQEEQKKLLRYYQTYFGRGEWKGSIFELYDTFLLEQNVQIPLPGNTFDIYDLAALAYIYKRIKENEVIQEASHVVIDEAQDFGMMVYGSLKYCLTKCTYTIMGDVSQNIYFDYGLTDWEELRSLMLPDKFDYFGLLKKSYRNTVEISNFAMEILQHGNFPIYPVEPIIRHGREVRTTGCKGMKELIAESERTIQEWQQEGYETIAVICRDEKEAAEAAKKLQNNMEIREFNAETEEFGKGVMVLPIEFSKGLEFDAVLLFNADDKNYPAEDGYAKLLYVAATRALHELAVLYSGKLTDLIATPVSEEKKRRVQDVVQKPVKRVVQEDTRTKQEIEMERAKEAHKEMELRHKYGPERIVVNKDNRKVTRETGDTRNTSESIGNGNNTGNLPQNRNLSPQMPRRYQNTSYLAGIGTASAGSTQGGKRAAGRAPQAGQATAENSEFGQMPDNTSLRPVGHASLNLSIRWVVANKNFVELTSQYGILRITPISENTVRVTFSKGAIDRLTEVPKELQTTGNCRWSSRDIRDKVEILCGKLILRVDKKSGAISFYTAKERLLLSESVKLARQIGDVPKKQVWNYFDWSKKEILKARGAGGGEWLDLSSTAKYISHGAQSDSPACIMSNQGYQIVVPAGKKVMCCTIPVYGPYLNIDGDTQIDYFLQAGNV